GTGTCPYEHVSTFLLNPYALPRRLRGARGPTRQMQLGLGKAYCGTGLYKQNVGRERGARLAQVVRSDQLMKLARSDVYWDEILEIEPDGEADVYDLTVDDLHNFVASDIVVHNS